MNDDLDGLTSEDIAELRAEARERLATYEDRHARREAAMRGVRLIERERVRQVEDEGWTPEHDDEHDACELTMAAHAYCYVAVGQVNGICWPDVEANVPNSWPWDDEWFKPSPDPIRNLVKAGALIAAEIDRLGRAQSEPTASEETTAASSDPLRAV